jgi:hypothetical protein
MNVRFEPYPMYRSIDREWSAWRFTTTHEPFRADDIYPKKKNNQYLFLYQ